MRPNPMLGLHHLALRVADVRAVRAFYVDILGFDIEREVAGEELWLTRGTDSLVFLREDPLGARGARLDHLGVLVREAADVSRWETHLRERGIPVLEPTETFDDGSVGLMCTDPEGHQVQILWHPSASPCLARGQS